MSSNPSILPKYGPRIFFLFCLFCLISQSFLALVSSSRTLSLHKLKHHFDENLTFLWPLPSQYTFGNQTLSVDPNISLVLEGNGGSSDIVKEAFQRYKNIIFKHNSKVSSSGLAYDIQKLNIIVHSENEEVMCVLLWLSWMKFHWFIDFFVGFYVDSCN